MSRKMVIFLVTALVGLILDQATKLWVVNNIAYQTGEIVVIPGFFSLVHAQNPGAAFGILRDLQPNIRVTLFLGFTLVAIGVIVDQVRRLGDREIFMPFTLGLILSGAIGNGVDRALKKTVTDFLRFYTDSPSWKPWLIETFGTYEYPSFNVADMALVGGVGLFMVYWLFLEERDEPAESNEPDDGTAPGNAEA